MQVHVLDPFRSSREPSVKYLNEVQELFSDAV